MSETAKHVEARVAELFSQLSGTRVSSLEVKRYPDETSIVAYVDEADFFNAVEVAEQVQTMLEGEVEQTTLVVVRKASTPSVPNPEPIDRRLGVRDERVAELVRLISARSRVSSAASNLVYLPDSRASLSAVTAARHHLVFGRRGAGKSALLVEARNRVVAGGDIASWTNIQTLRRESSERIFLYVISDILRSLLSSRTNVPAKSSLYSSITELGAHVNDLLASDSSDTVRVERIVPRVQRALSDYMSVDGRSVYVFIDDFYYVSRAMQPAILDMVHAAVRDSNVWLKIASIRHLTNWWQAAPPLGLQSGQDADLIDLDVTLQDPEGASTFLEGILLEYARQVGVGSLSRIFNRAALDRLVLASGAVPRDYMVLAVSAIARALRRGNARLVGVQDVNQVAGDAANSKIQELEEDMAANEGAAARTLATLSDLRSFCLDEKAFTYFLVGYRDKESLATEYSLLADLLDVRLIHLVDHSVSGGHEAGSRFEAFMLDLSQFSGSRLKQKINVLDFDGGHFLARQTRGVEAAKRGGTSRELIAILRAAPTYELSRLSEKG
jgi:hypothetical protein